MKKKHFRPYEGCVLEVRDAKKNLPLDLKASINCKAKAYEPGACAVSLNAINAGVAFRCWTYSNYVYIQETPQKAIVTRYKTTKLMQYIQAMNDWGKTVPDMVVVLRKPVGVRTLKYMRSEEARRKRRKSEAKRKEGTARRHATHRSPTVSAVIHIREHAPRLSLT